MATKLSNGLELELEKIKVSEVNSKSFKRPVLRLTAALFFLLKFFSLFSVLSICLFNVFNSVKISGYFGMVSSRTGVDPGFLFREGKFCMGTGFLNSYCHANTRCSL